MSTDKKEYGISVIMPCYNTEQYVEEILENFKISSHIRWRNVKLTNNQSEERRQIEIY